MMTWARQLQVNADSTSRPRKVRTRKGVREREGDRLRGERDRGNIHENCVEEKITFAHNQRAKHTNIRAVGVKSLVSTNLPVQLRSRQLHIPTQTTPALSQHRDILFGMGQRSTIGPATTTIQHGDDNNKQKSNIEYRQHIACMLHSTELAIHAKQFVWLCYKNYQIHGASCGCGE